MLLVHGFSQWAPSIPRHFMDPEHYTTDFGPRYHPPYPVVPTLDMLDPSCRLRESSCRFSSACRALPFLAQSPRIGARSELLSGGARLRWRTSSSTAARWSTSPTTRATTPVPPPPLPLPSHCALSLLLRFAMDLHVNAADCGAPEAPAMAARGHRSARQGGARSSSTRRMRLRSNTTCDACKAGHAIFMAMHTVH